MPDEPIVFTAGQLEFETAVATRGGARMVAVRAVNDVVNSLFVMPVEVASRLADALRDRVREAGPSEPKAPAPVGTGGYL